MPSGVLTAALACSAIQLISNELRVQRVKFIAARQQATAMSPLPTDLSKASLSTPASASDLLSKPDTRFPETPSASGYDSSYSETQSYFERALSLIGISRVDDAEYLRRLKAKREAHLTRMRALEAQIDEERSKGS